MKQNETLTDVNSVTPERVWEIYHIVDSLATTILTVFFGPDPCSFKPHETDSAL